MLLLLYNKNDNEEKMVTKIKLWVSDIDGTIMNYDGSFTSNMKNLIESLNNSDIKFVLATGRMFDGAYHEAKKFNVTTPIICYQGAVVRTKDEILWQSLVDNDLAYEIIDYLKEKNLHTHVYNNDILYVDDDNKPVMKEYCGDRGTTYTVVDDLKELKLEHVAKILAIIDDKALMKEIKQELKEKYKGKLTIVQSSPKYLEINDINASKGNALNFLKDFWNIKKEEILASGDQDNDIELLKNAGVKVCVGKNSKKLYELADYNCKDVNSDELVEVIKKYL